jgi:hypothetical protein
MEKKTDKKHLRKIVIGLLAGVSTISLVGVGVAGWVVAASPFTLNGINVDAGTVTTVTNNYLYTSGTQATEKLQYNDYGFVYNDDIGTIGHLVYHLIFDSAKFLSAFGKTSETVYFFYSLAYKSYQSGFTLIDSYLSCTTKVWDTNTTYIASGTTLTQTTSNHVASCDTLSNLLSITSSKPVTYITLDYKFDVGTNFNTVKSNELTKTPTFVLSANAGIKR